MCGAGLASEHPAWLEAPTDGKLISDAPSSCTTPARRLLLLFLVTGVALICAPPHVGRPPNFAMWDLNNTLSLFSVYCPEICIFLLTVSHHKNSTNQSWLFCISCSSLFNLVFCGDLVQYVCFLLECKLLGSRALEMLPLVSICLMDKEKTEEQIFSLFAQ